jgi:hypothetical protein
MIIERFRYGAAPVYARFRERGRLAPDGAEYIDSWVTADLTRCYQVMEADDPALIQEWIDRLADLVEFEIVPVISSVEAAERAS